MSDEIKISIDLFRRMESQIRDLQADNDRLQREVREATLHDLPPEIAEKLGAARVTLLADTIRAQFEIVAFAVANLHPLTVRGWPYQRLLQLSELIPNLGGILPVEQSVTFLLFAEKCKKWEDARAAGIEQQLLAEENAAKAISPEAAKRYGLQLGVAPDFSQPLITTTNPSATTAGASEPTDEATTGASPG